MKDIYGCPIEEEKIVDIRTLLNQITPTQNPTKTRQSNLDDFKAVSAKKYTQNWPAYDKAKTNEVMLFKQLLRELLFLAVQEDLPVKGRKAYSTRDQLFCMCVHVFCSSSLRKTQSILKEYKQLKYLDKVPCYKTINNFFYNEKLIKILDDLLMITFLPVSGLEETGAIDSTGFGLRLYQKWIDHKYGDKEKKEKTWRMAHAACGTRTNVFFSVKVTPQNTADAPMFEKVVGKKPRYFPMENFVADKAYSSRRIVEFITNLGLDPYIPFKKNVTGKARGSKVWAELFKKFIENHEYYMKKYHQRSNIEAAFHMIKRRFGQNVSTKQMIANKNEIKVKFLCHNLCCLLQEVFESDINIDFFACVKKMGLCKV